MCTSLLATPTPLLLQVIFSTNDKKKKTEKKQKNWKKKTAKTWNRILEKIWVIKE